MIVRHTMRIRNVKKKTRSFLQNLELLVMCWFYHRTSSGSGALVTSKNCPINLLEEFQYRNLLPLLVFGSLKCFAKPSHLSSSDESPLSCHALELCKCDHAATLTVLVISLYLPYKLLSPLIDCQYIVLELILPLRVGFRGHLKHLFFFKELIKLQ